MTKTEETVVKNTPEQAARPAAPQINWDHAKLKTSYANVCNVNSTREEVSLLFGTNNSVNTGEPGEITIELSDRIILNPYVAKRLAGILGNVVRNYEENHGVLQL